MPTAPTATTPPRPTHCAADRCGQPPTLYIGAWYCPRHYAALLRVVKRLMTTTK
jgi:hypothetical protein